MPKKLTPETQAKRAIKRFLDSIGIFNFPVLQGMGAYKGMPDRIAVYNGRFIGIEVKAPGGKLSEYQQAFKQRTEVNGGLYITAYSIDDVIKALGMEDRFIMPKQKGGKR
jgi:hypothetical protein